MTFSLYTHNKHERVVSADIAQPSFHIWEARPHPPTPSPSLAWGGGGNTTPSFIITRRAIKAAELFQAALAVQHSVFLKQTQLSGIMRNDTDLRFYTLNVM